MSKTNKNNQWSCNLQTILEQKAISRYKLIKDTKIHKNTIYFIGNRDLHLSTIIAICNYLNITIDELISIK